MDNIILDKSGKLIPGIFYEFGIPSSDIPNDLAAEDPQNGWIVVERTPNAEELERTTGQQWLGPALVEGKGSPQHRCPLSKSHSTEEYWDDVAVDIYGGPRIPDLMQCGVDPIMIVNGAFATQLAESGLTGIGLKPVRINENLGKARNVTLKLFECLGTNCERPLSIVGFPNACPFCGRKPLLCPACGQAFTKCPDCGKLGWTPPDWRTGPDDRSAIISPAKDRWPRILEGSRWDGSDFIYAARSPEGERFMTKRALNWLLSVHAAPFYAQPALVNVAGLNDEQLARIEAAKTLPVPKSK